MKTKFHWIFVYWLLSSIALGQKTYLDSEENIRLFRFFLKVLPSQLFGSTSDEGSWQLQEARKQRRVQNRIPDDVPFPCDVSAGRSQSVPTSVHKLRPGDIDVIAAMGDSLTAGTGIFSTSLFSLVMENRGASAVGGGQSTWRNYLTIPNIIKEFNPNLIGYSPHDSATYQESSELNVAELFAMSRDLPFMAETLIRRMKSHPKVDMKNQWKLISIIIGHNDFCNDMCWLPTGAWTSLKNHKTELIETLRILKKNLPRTLVQLIPPPNLIVIARLKNKSPTCTFTTTFECPCLVGLPWEGQREEFIEIMSSWQKVDEEIATYPEFQTDDFAVVAQPFTTNLTFPTTPDGNTDWRYLSSDCFHLSQLSNARVTLAIWKNMLEPVGKKTRDWEMKTVKCPTESHPYIMTAANIDDEQAVDYIHNFTANRVVKNIEEALYTF